MKMKTPFGTVMALFLGAVFFYMLGNVSKPMVDQMRLLTQEGDQTFSAETFPIEFDYPHGWAIEQPNDLSVFASSVHPDDVAIDTSILVQLEPKADYFVDGAELYQTVVTQSLEANAEWARYVHFATQNDVSPIGAIELDHDGEYVENEADVRRIRYRALDYPNRQLAFGGREWVLLTSVASFPSDPVGFSPYSRYVWRTDAFTEMPEHILRLTVWCEDRTMSACESFFWRTFSSISIEE